VPSVYGLNTLITATRKEMASDHRVQIAGISESLVQLLLLALCTGAQDLPAAQHIVIVVPTNREVNGWAQFLDHMIELLANDTASYQVTAAVLPYFVPFGSDRFVNPKLARRQRIFALDKLLEARAAIVITTLNALAQRSLAPNDFQQASLLLHLDEEHDPDELVSKFEDLGYAKAASVEEEGQYALRGGILDVFPLNELYPIRIEFIGDTVTSLRRFSLVDQKSIAAIKQVKISPAGEALTPHTSRKADAQKLYDVLVETHMHSGDRDGMVRAFQEGVRFSGFDLFAPLFRPSSALALDYAADHTVMLFPASITSCFTKFEEFYEKITTSAEQDAEKKRPTISKQMHFASPEELQAKLDQFKNLIEVGNPYASANVSLIRVEGRLHKDGIPLGGMSGAELFDKWCKLIESIVGKEQGQVAILTHSDEQTERVKNLLQHRGIDVRREPALMLRVVRGELSGSEVYVGRGDLSSHLWLEESATLILPDHVLFGARNRKAKPASVKLQNYLSSFMDLKVGDLVVHVQHGIGKYSGLTTLEVAGAAGDFLIIEYAGGDKIYLPVDNLNMLQRYSAGVDGHESSQALDRLRSGNWEKRKAKVRGSIRVMAEELLKLQAKRAIASIGAYPPPDDTYLQFESEFPYIETDDQLRAIQDVEADLRGGKPMDRLVCGDVGFGKTEVAIRAAMRAVLEGSQVLILVPTTVLCYQHYRTFQSRLEKHGVRVAQANRFVKSTDMKLALEGLKNGTIDVLVGTHRILSKDIKPKKLGLLVVDEEQRFGVAHKERLKELRAGAHVLTLTATPIPRTLHMAMVGLRDISIIATPPQDRVSVKTYIAKFDEDLIREAIDQEVRRGGQVFFVHNRVEDIEQIRQFIRRLVPQYEVRVGHGQMSEHQLEQVIVDFLEQKYPVLLCTTIIESGIDMPNVNTLIVNRADRFGLAQLYQLRGRVGRSNLQAYAYFLTPADERLSEEAKRRLDILSANQELGAGFQIASYDLELRGAGNLLGGEQTGHAAAVGLELYTEMLEAAINDIRGEEVKIKIDTEIKLPVSAHIPTSYIASENQRLHLYKRLFAAETDEAIVALCRDTEDRFGSAPHQFGLLIRIARLKHRLRACSAARVSYGQGAVEIKFAQLTAEQIDALIKIVARQPKVYRLTTDYRLFLAMPTIAKLTLFEQDKLLDRLLELVDPLAESLA